MVMTIDLDAEGLFRLSGSMADLQKFKARYDKGMVLCCVSYTWWCGWIAVICYSSGRFIVILRSNC